MNITITTIPHGAQRYPTAGDWQFDENGNLTITVSNMGHWRNEFLVALHEMVEAAMCKQDRISQEQVDHFDMTWEPQDDLSEPGDDPRSPYHLHHVVALAIEYGVGAALGVDMGKHEEALDALG